MYKNNRRKKKKQKLLHKAKFKQMFCTKCGICPIGSNPKFCYGVLYKNNPEQFTNVVFPKIMENHDILKDQIVPDFEGNTLLITAFFNNILCDDEICTKCTKNKDTDKILNCLAKFRLQCKPGYQTVQEIKNQWKKERKAQNKIKQANNLKLKANATVTVLMSTDAEFLEAVEKILGNNNKQQN